MRYQQARVVYPLAIFAGTVLLFYVTYAFMMGWLPFDDDRRDDAHALSQTKWRYVPVDAPSAKAVPCAACGVIISVREVSAAAGVSAYYAQGYGATGVLPPHPVNPSHDLLDVIGAVLGAMVGNRYAGRTRASRAYEITIFTEDGANRVVIATDEPEWQPGDRVRIVNDHLVTLM